MTDLRQAPQYSRYVEILGWHVVSRQQAAGSWHLFVRKLPLLGAIAKLQRPSGKIIAEEIDKIARQHKVAACYIEPILHATYYMSHGFIPARSSFLPSKTIQIDLTQSEEKILAGMQKRTRYSIRQAEKHGVWVETSQNVEEFIKLWRKTARRRGMFLSQKKEIQSLFRAFGNSAHLLFAYPPNLTLLHKSVTFHHSVAMEKPLAGVLMIETRDITYYMYAASTKTGNKLCAPSLLVWEAIKLAKKEKCKVFDFEGIYDERYPQTKAWRGFTRFKEGFGGKTMTYPGTFVKYYNPLAKLLRL